MIPTVSIRQALADKQLLGQALSGSTWESWRILLTALMGEKLTAAERKVFTTLTGRATEPLQRVEEFCAVVGRRGGKSRAMATLACYIAALCQHKLVPGETGVVLLIAPDQRQAAIALEYADAGFATSPILKQMVANRTADTLTLTNGISLEVRSSSFRRLRGPTYIAVIADEAAFWHSEDYSSNADTEILNAVRPGLTADDDHPASNSFAPLIMFAAGPGTITTVVTMAVVHTPHGLPITAIVAAVIGAGVTLVVLLLVIATGSHFGRGTQAVITRFMGLIVASMGMQFVLAGLKAFFSL